MTRIFFFLAISYVSHSFSQTIDIEFPKFAGKTYDLILFQGSANITAIQDTIPKNGKLSLKIPREYAPYMGMCRWLITGTAQGGGLDMAIPGHDFKVSCLSDTPCEQNIRYIGFDAVNELNRLHRQQQSIIDKFETMTKATVLYDHSHPLYKTFIIEKEAQIRAYDLFHQHLEKNTNYNARVLPLINLINGIPPKLTSNYEEKAVYVNDYIVHKLHYDHLYTAGYWTSIIQSWVQMHAQMFHDKERFVKDFKTISERITDKKKYTDWVGKVTYYLSLYGRDDFVEAIAPVVLSSGKILSYEGKTMQVYVKAMIGIQAPDLVITEHIGSIDEHNHDTYILKASELAANGYQKTLLVFYQSGCGPCEQLMQQLPQKYAAIKDKGIRVISLSADEGEQVYANSSRDYPWPDKYCDFKGKTGVNFSNYAVTGTPTLILLDKKGKVEKRLATLSELYQ